MRTRREWITAGGDLWRSATDLAKGSSAQPGVVHVVDDDEAVRRAIAMLLKSVGIPVETHASGTAFLGTLRSQGAADTAVGCVLTDVRMPGVGGLDLLRCLSEAGFRRPIIVMTAHGDVAMAVQAMKAGASDFIEKPFDDEVLLAAVDSALTTPIMSAAGVDAPEPAAADAEARIAALSKREREVLELLVAGKSNKRIAQELGLSPRTVEVHRARLMMHLKVESLAEAVRLAVQAELSQRSRAGSAKAEDS